MFRKIIEKIGFMLIANSVLFTPIIASADGNGALGFVCGAGIVGFVTGAVLVSMSKTKIKATKADKYIDGLLELKNKEDTFVNTTTERRKVGN